MNSLSYSVKGVRVKKLNNNNLIPDESLNKEIAQLLRIKKFKNLMLFEDILLDKRHVLNFAKEYLKESKLRNDFNSILNAEKDDPVRFVAIIPDSYRSKILSQFNPNKK